MVQVCFGNDLCQVLADMLQIAHMTSRKGTIIGFSIFHVPSMHVVFMHV